jgi:hypothetical protein
MPESMMMMWASDAATAAMTLTTMAEDGPLQLL